MSTQTDELKNIVASLQNVVEALDAQEKVDAETAPVDQPVASVEVAPDTPVPGDVAEPTLAEPVVTAVPVQDGDVADNTPSANPDVETVDEVPTPQE